jgi:nucleoside-diphosphate-sugar epimerase
VKKVLVTGNQGFVGRYFEDFLIKQNWQIFGVDLKNGIDCRDFFKKSNDVYDLVIHLAAIVGGRKTIETEPLSVATDLSIDSEMFNWAIRTKQRRVIYFSSSAAYPIRKQIKNSNIFLSEQDINLEDIKNPDNTYGWAKLTGELLASAARKKGLKTYVFRPFSGYGTDQDLDYPFPSFIYRAKNKIDPFEIWGDGEQVRDFIHITDIVQACMKALELDIEDPINLGNGTPFSFNQLAEMIFTESGWRPPQGIKHIETNPTGVMFRCSDCSLLKSFYTPKVDLVTGINKALRGEKW